MTRLLIAGCSWNLDGIRKWKQDFWDWSTIALHLGDLFNVAFVDAEGWAVCQRVTEHTQVECHKKVSVWCWREDMTGGCMTSL